MPSFLPAAAVAAAAIASTSPCANYSMTLLPPPNATVTSLVVRGYERFVYGDREGFMAVADGAATSKDAAPTLSYALAANATRVTDLPLTLFGFYDGTASGSLGFGFDQYGVYWGPTGKCAAGTPAGKSAPCTPNFDCCGEGSSFNSCSVGLYEDARPGAPVVLRGSFLAPYAYTDVNVKFSDGSTAYATDFEYSCDRGDSLNPYVPGNPTVYATAEAGASVATPLSAVGSAVASPAASAAGSAEGSPAASPAASPVASPPASPAASPAEAKKIPLYRPDRLHGSSYGMDRAAPGECSDEYLCTVRDHEEMVASAGGGDANSSSSSLVLPEYLVLRVKLPRVFVRSDDAPPDAVFEQQDEGSINATTVAYEARYWSVSSHYAYTYPDPPPRTIANWWTVNARQLFDYLEKEEAGAGDDKEHGRRDAKDDNDLGARGRSGSSSSGLVATVFFLPPAEAVALQRAQDLPSWAPPKLTVNVPASRTSTSSPTSFSLSPPSSREARAVTGLVLPRPDFVVFRYRVPDPHFAGSPATAPCYATAATNRPIRRTAGGGMGSYTPQLFGCGNHSSSAAFAASLGDPESPCGAALI